MDTGLLHKGPVRLGRGSVLRLRHAAGRHLGVVRGAVWITQDGDLRDSVVEAGASFRFDRGGLALVMPLGAEASLVLEDGLAARNGTEGRTPLASAPGDAWAVHSRRFEREARRMRAEAVTRVLAGAAQALRRLWRRTAERVSAGMRARRTGAELRALSDHLLKDIGLRRSDIDCVARQLPC